MKNTDETLKIISTSNDVVIYEGTDRYAAETNLVEYFKGYIEGVRGRHEYEGSEPLQKFVDDALKDIEESAAALGDMISSGLYPHSDDANAATLGVSVEFYLKY